MFLLNQLSSKDSTKYSKHIIYKIPLCAFIDNYHCGAVIRNFHSHLISKFGNIERNKFYISPFDDAKEKHRVCMLDLAVYTKNRDFRLVGSAKRMGSSDPNNTIRWLWTESNAFGGLGKDFGQKGAKLSKNLFLSCLIQNIDENIKYSLCYVYDTINNGNPRSSRFVFLSFMLLIVCSLRTLQPVGTTSNKNTSSKFMTSHQLQKYENSSSSSSSIELPQSIVKKLEIFGQKVAKSLGWIKFVSVYITDDDQR